MTHKCLLNPTVNIPVRKQIGKLCPGLVKKSTKLKSRPGLPCPLTHDLIQQDGCGCGQIEAVDLAKHGNGKPLVCRLQPLLAEAVRLAAQDDSHRSRAIDSVCTLLRPSGVAARMRS